MRVLKNLLARLVEGVVLGCSAGVAFAVVSHYLSVYMIESQWEVTQADKSLPNYGLKFSETRAEEQDGKIVILGKIENPLDYRVGRAWLEVEFFNSEGDFVEKCHSRMAGSLEPNEVRNIRIRCEEYKFEFERYEIEVVSVSNY